MSVRLAAILLYLVPTLLSAQFAYHSYETDLPAPSTYAARRAALRSTLPPRSAMVILSADERNRQNDVNYEYRQSSYMLYLTGFPHPKAALLLLGEGVANGAYASGERFFMRQRDTTREQWTGVEMGMPEAEKYLGLLHTAEYGELANVIKSILPDIDTLYLPNLPTKTVSLAVLGRNLGVIGELTRELNDKRGSGITGESLAVRTSWPPLVAMREVKDTTELRLMQRAIDITIAGHRAAMQGTRPGMKEYEIEALMEYTFKRMGAEDVGYPSIVGSSYNACILHYTGNRRPTITAELVLADCGAEYHGYTADVTRTFPVSGKFSPEQRIIYDIVLEAQDSGIAAARAGVPFKDPHHAATSVIARRLVEIGVLDDEENVKTYFMHGTSHYLGLDVHDVGAQGPLRENTVITVEPGIYIAENSPCDPKWWNIGVRIEDDILVTARGPVNMSAALPRSAAAIEALVGKP